MNPKIFHCDKCGVTSPELTHVANAVNMATSHRCGDVCVACGWRKANRGKSRSRGLCKICHSDPEIRADFPRKTFSSDELLAEWDLLRRQGFTMRQAAPRLGITLSALDQAITRAKRKGDPRAVRQPTGRKVFNQHTTQEAA